mgnify:CR=1 FL=1
MKKIITVITPLFVLSTLVGCNKAPAKEYIVSFESKGGTHVEPIRVKKGKMISKPEVEMHKDGYDFQRWCTDEACTEEFVFDTTKITNDITLYADWGTIKQCTVTFYLVNPTTQEREVYKAVPVTYGMPVVPPVDPESKMAGVIFDSWHTHPQDDEGDKEYEFGNLVTSDLELFARWTAFDYNLIIVDPNGGTFEGDTSYYKYFSAPGGGDYKWSDIKNQCIIEKAPTGYELDGHKYWVCNLSSGEFKDITTDDYDLSGENAYYIYVDYVQKQETLTFQENPNVEGNTGWSRPEETFKYPYGTRWIDVKDNFTPALYKGWEFVNFYYVENDQQIIVRDDYVFTDKTRIFIPNYKVKIEFANEEGTDYGILPYGEATVPLGTKWGDIASSYRPTEKDPGTYAFKYFTVKGSEFHGDDLIKKPYIKDHHDEGDIRFKAHYEPTPADNFQNDSWSAFCVYLNSVPSWEALIQEGAPYQDDYINNGNKFVGLTRKIKVFDVEYDVRVVNQYETGGSGNPFFEFEFVNLLNYAMPYATTPTGKSDYAGSYINYILNNVVFFSFPEIVRNSIKENNSIGYYKTVDDPIHEVRSVEYCSGKLFTLSLQEMGYAATDLPTIYQSYFPVEGDVLPYYTEHSAYSDKAKKLPGGENPDWYWTRSAEISNDGYVSWQINNEGKIGDIYGEPALNTESMYVAPAFLI